MSDLLSGLRRHPGVRYPTVLVDLDDVREALLSQLDEWQPLAPEQNAYWAGYSKALSDVRRWAGGDQ